MIVWLFRSLFVVALTFATAFLNPIDLRFSVAATLGAAIAVSILIAEQVVRRCSMRTLIGAVFGSLVGLLGALLVSNILSNMVVLEPATATFLQVLTLALMTYLGLMVGIAKGDLLNINLGGIFKERARRSAKILDTSVVIDGRVADIIETGFLEGPITVPEFVLKELQLVADSSDSIKRNRGRRGLDILRQIQKKSNVSVNIVEDDFPEIRAVDHKLIELAKEQGGTIVTNDFNLNKVAQLRGVAVLNINELANSLKPVVLPGESMKVFILKEGKEYNQGVAYLDDGTMVVVDNARRMIGKNIDIQVTSVLQTTAGKMIFGRFSVEGQGQAGSEYSRPQRVSRL